PELKARLKEEVDQAMQVGVFGSPYVIIDGEAFFGADRLPQIEKWLANGGF
ncbi:MAG TPA: DsbA family protein, partial [Azonexus sp.]|nr:DsbA family protein [Azonexus sp.]